VLSSPAGQVGSPGQLGGAGVAGEYSRVGDHNGHPLYTGPANTALWYRKAGWGPDGWILGPNPHQGEASGDWVIATRSLAHCPDQVQRGEDRAGVEDPALRLVCLAAPTPQDPAVAAGPPAPPAQRPVSAAARDTLLSSACFRILVITFCLVQRLADQ